MTSILAKFKTLHSELQTLLACPSPNPHLLQTKITQYIALMVEEDKPDHSQELMFDHFCECGGVAILSGLLGVDSLLAIRSYSLLFINLRNEMWVSFILCQGFVTQAIETKCDADEEEWTEYFVSFLKSLSIRLNATQITLFFNKKCPRFPLVYEAMKFFNHPDFMVRTSVMNIILELMKISEDQTRIYFSRFPFSAYLVTFACEVHNLIVSHQAKITLGQLSVKYLESYSVDLSDYLYYFNDLMAFGTQQAVQIIENTFISYIVVPMLKWLLSGESLRVKHALLVLEEAFKIIKNPVIVDTIGNLLFEDRISAAMLQRIKEEEVYIPLVYQQEFNPNEFYWSQYQKEITRECLKVFQDLVNFQIEFEEYPFQDKPGFAEEVGKISNFIGYDLLESKRTVEFNSVGEDQVDNPFRKLVEDFIRSNSNDEVILVANTLYKLLEKKGSQNVPKFMESFISLIIEQLSAIEWEKTKFACLESCLMLLKLYITEASSIEFEEELLHNYRRIGHLLNDSLTSDHITLIVDHFHKHYTLITRKFNAPYNEEMPYATFFLPSTTWTDPNPNYSLPALPLPLLIQHFILFRSFVNSYFTRFYQAEYCDFQQAYEEQFQATTSRWKKGERYRIAKKTLIPCSIDARSEKKGRKGLIVEDEHNLVVGEIDAEGDCRILANCSWKAAHLVMSKDDPVLIDIRTDSERLTLSFEDAVRANTTLAELSDVRWRRYQEELCFLVKFVRRCLEE